MANNIADSTCEIKSFPFSNYGKAQPKLIPQVLDPLTPQSSGWEPSNNKILS